MGVLVKGDRILQKKGEKEIDKTRAACYNKVTAKAVCAKSMNAVPHGLASWARPRGADEESAV